MGNGQTKLHWYVLGQDWNRALRRNEKTRGREARTFNHCESYIAQLHGNIFSSSISYLTICKHSTNVRVLYYADGDLPLHLACYDGQAPPAVIRALIDAYPDSVRKKNRMGLDPLQLAARNYRVGHPYRSQVLTLLRGHQPGDSPSSGMMQECAIGSPSEPGPATIAMTPCDQTQESAHHDEMSRFEVVEKIPTATAIPFEQANYGAVPSPFAPSQSAPPLVCATVEVEPEIDIGSSLSQREWRC